MLWPSGMPSLQQEVNGHNCPHKSPPHIMSPLPAVISANQISLTHVINNLFKTNNSPSQTKPPMQTSDRSPIRHG